MFNKIEETKEEKKIEFNLGENFVLLLDGFNKTVEVFNKEIKMSCGTYGLRLYSKKYQLNKDDLNNISNFTGFNTNKIKQTINEVNIYLKNNESKFINKSSLNTFYIPPQAHQEDIMRAVKFFIEDNYVFADYDTIDNDNVLRYIFNTLENKFIKLSNFRLGEYLLNKYNFLIAKEDAPKIIDGIYKSEKSNNNYVQFENGFYNIQTHNLETEPVFTHNIINHNYIPLNNCAENTLIEKTLKEILIPKNNQSDTKLYDTTLYYLGASLLGIKPKVILEYYDKGNGGKTILMSIISTLFGQMNLTLKEQELVDKFTQGSFGDKCTMILDELSANAFRDVDTRAIIKEISGNGTFCVREIKTASMKLVKNTGLIICASNYLPKVDNSDVAYYERLQLLCPPNSFVSKINDDGVNENVYLANPSISYDVTNDEAGYSWLISKAIDTYLNHDINEFYQTDNKTLALVNGGDLISSFVSTYVMEAEDEKLTNKVLVYYFMKYCISNDFNYTDIEDCNDINQLRQLIGRVMKRVGYKKGSSFPVYYNDCVLHIDFKDKGVFNDDDFREVENKFFCYEG